VFWILITAAAGFCLGIFGFPMKLTHRWKWEHTWLMYAFWALLVMPWVIALVTVPSLFEVYRQIAVKVFVLVSVMGTLWGVANITFGLGLRAMGIALGYSIMLGLIIIFGTIMPMVINPKAQTFTKQSAAIIAGVTVMVLSLVVNVIAAFRKDRELSVNPVSNTSEVSVPKGLLLCFLTGIFAVGLNYAFIYGEPLQTKAVELGSTASMSPNAKLPVIFTGASLLTIAYCGVLIHKGRTWHLFTDRENGKYFLLTAFMAVWTIGISTFGIAAPNMGKLGHSVGWSVLNSSAIFWANVIGFASGEWKGVSAKTMGVFLTGLVIMLLGICIAGWANSLT
jgi:L-rhamnose-H+ transport protein